MNDIPGHHLVYGTLTDYLTGEELTDTDDERIRQQLARFMVEEKGYEPGQLEPRLSLETVFNKTYVKSTIDLTVRLDGKRVMILRYGPGSLVTRERSAVAAARLLDPACRIPLAVVTNGRDAELLDTHTGAVLARGMEGIPARDQLLAMLPELLFEPFTDPEKREKEERILNAFDLQVCCRGMSCPAPKAGK
ncbi:type I restriction enzyme HsdR N-terminal domain-containing protein [Desulfolithobacter sp.]